MFVFNAALYYISDCIIQIVLHASINCEEPVRLKLLLLKSCTKLMEMMFYAERQVDEQESTGKSDDGWIDKWTGGHWEND